MISANEFKDSQPSVMFAVELIIEINGSIVTLNRKGSRFSKPLLGGTDFQDLFCFDIADPAFDPVELAKKVKFATEQFAGLRRALVKSMGKR